MTILPTLLVLNATKALHPGRKIPYRLDAYKLLNRTSSRIIRVAAASGQVQEFPIVLPPKVKIKNSARSVYSRLYGTHVHTDRVNRAQ